MTFTAKSAKTYLELKWPVKVKKCLELPGKFVFETYPKNGDKNKTYMDSLISVGKNDGIIRVVYPPNEPNIDKAKEVSV